jgi:hypothetical protein
MVEYAFFGNATGVLCRSDCEVVISEIELLPLRCGSRSLQQISERKILLRGTHVFSFDFL